MSAEINLEGIKSALFAFMGIKPKVESIDEQLEKISLPKAKITSEEMKAWAAQGYKPSLPEFLKQFRKGKNG